MNICIIPVCFNAHKDAQRLLHSIDCAYRASLGVTLSVILADNSNVVPSQEFDSSDYAYTFILLKNDNIGYFPAFNKALSSLNRPLDEFDYVIVCNVDLIVADDFVAMLKAHSAEPETGLIAPSIYSERNGLDLNPAMKNRPSIMKIQFMRLICSSVFLFHGYSRIAQLRELLHPKLTKLLNFISPSPNVAKQIRMYGAHGSFMIFTKRYFSKGAHVSYPRFLFGEEGFVAEQLLINGLSIEHVPCIKVFDKEHGSTSKSAKRFICAEHKKSYDYFYENFIKIKL